MNNTGRKGMVFVLSGPSGVGKDTVREPFLASCPNLYQSVSATTRTMRPGETDGVDYHFLSRETFVSMIEKGEFLEHTLYNDNYYGTPAPFVAKMLEEGKDVLLKIEVQGALHVKEFFPDAVLVFLVPPTMQVLWERITGRGTEEYEARKARFTLAYRELRFAQQYDYIVTSGDLDECVQTVRAIYTAEQSKRCRAEYKVDNLTQEVLDI